MKVTGLQEPVSRSEDSLEKKLSWRLVIGVVETRDDAVARRRRVVREVVGFMVTSMERAKGQRLVAVNVRSSGTEFP